MVVKLAALWAAAAAAGLTGTALAADSSSSAPVTSLFLPGFDHNGANLVASVVTVKSPATHYFVQCDEDTDEEDCGAGSGVSVTMAPGSYALGLGEPATVKQTCLMNGDEATCTAYSKGSGGDDDMSTVVTMKDITSDDFFAAATLTAGVEKLRAAATASSDGGGGASGSGMPTAGGAPSSGPAATGTPSSDGPDSAGNPLAAAPPPAVLTGLVALIGCALAL